MGTIGLLRGLYGTNIIEELRSNEDRKKCMGEQSALFDWFWVKVHDKSS